MRRHCHRSTRHENDAETTARFPPLTGYSLQPGTYHCHAVERRLVRAYSGTVLPEERAPRSLSRAPGSYQAKDKKILRMRSEQYLERKAQLIQFKRSVARTLDEK